MLFPRNPLGFLHEQRAKALRAKFMMSDFEPYAATAAVTHLVLKLGRVSPMDWNRSTIHM